MVPTVGIQTSIHPSIHAAMFTEHPLCVGTVPGTTGTERNFGAQRLMSLCFPAKPLHLELVQTSLLLFGWNTEVIIDKEDFPRELQGREWGWRWGDGPRSLIWPHVGQVLHWGICTYCVIEISSQPIGCHHPIYRQS